MNTEDNFFLMAINTPSGISMPEVYEPAETTEAQKFQVWAELKAQEEIFWQDRSILFSKYKQ